MLPYLFPISSLLRGLRALMYSSTEACHQPVQLQVCIIACTASLAYKLQVYVQLVKLKIVSNLINYKYS